MTMSTANADMLIRAEVWANELKMVLEDTLDAQQWVDWMTDFPDGTTWTMPSVGDAETQTIQEGIPVRYDTLDTGEFQFQVTEYVGSAHAMYRKLMHDSFYANRVLGEFVPKQKRAILERLETDILKTFGPNASQGGGQTAGSLNAINGFNHRFAGSGTGGVLVPADWAYAKLALKKAKVPMSKLISIVDPTTAYHLETATNIVNVSNNPQWEGVINTGLTQGMRFIRNVYGFDVYESNYLDNATSTDIAYGSFSTIAGAAVADTAQNVMFSAESAILPILGAWRQMPEVDAEFNKDLQREEYVTTCYYGLKNQRLENTICVLSRTDQA